jgi:hypothetical protein
MITIISILITWYVTKIYYTRSFKLEVEDSGLAEAICVRCGKKSFINPENLRVSYYCPTCK